MWAASTVDSNFQSNHLSEIFLSFFEYAENDDITLPLYLFHKIKDHILSNFSRSLGDMPDRIWQVIFEPIMFDGKILPATWLLASIE